VRISAEERRMQLKLTGLVGREITLDDEDEAWGESNPYVYRDRRTYYRGRVLAIQVTIPPSLTILNARTQRELKLNPDNWTIRDAATGELLTPPG
jgi:hypothetical protein